MGLALIPCDIAGETGLDVRVFSWKATVSDLLAALQAATDDPRLLKPYHRQRYARCAGCVNNCCKHNSITVDLVAAEMLAAGLSLNLKQFAQRYLSLRDDLPYPELLRRPCPFLHQNHCTQYAARALICRLYLCTPMTDRLEQLRAAVSFAGEAALKQRLMELGLGPTRWSRQWERQQLRQRFQSGEISREVWDDQQEQLDLLWLHNPFTDGLNYDQVKLVNCCTDAVWRRMAID